MYAWMGVSFLSLLFFESFIRREGTMEEANDGMIRDTTFVDWNQELSTVLLKQLPTMRL